MVPSYIRLLITGPAVMTRYLLTRSGRLDNSYLPHMFPPDILIFYIRPEIHLDGLRELIGCVFY
jgi:hypothetical protein